MDTTRYSRQILFGGIGAEGQVRLQESRAVIIGCGALGSVHAELLARAGVGKLTIVDRDFVEESNLQRQTLFDEDDARQNLPKAVAAAKRIRRINSATQVTPEVVDAGPHNIEDLIARSDVVLDGTDNFEARFLINDAASKLRIPWVYGAAVGSYGLTMTVIPGRTPCLRCVVGDLPAAGGATCDTAGVIGPIVNVIGSIQTAEALKLLAGRQEALHGGLVQIDLWDFRLHRTPLSRAEMASDCPACNGRYEFLSGASRPAAESLCGRDAVQISAPRRQRMDFADLARRLEPLGAVSFNEYLLKFRVDKFDITVFADSRSIIRGTADPGVARSLYARYIGT